MNIPGTHLETSEIMMSGDFVIGDTLRLIVEIPDLGNFPNYIITNKIDHNTYNVKEILYGNELEIAIEHFKFLKKYNLI